MTTSNTESHKIADISAINIPLDVLVIGAGFSGVCAAIKLLEKGISNFRVFEKSQGIGGTWWDNTYPGAACDVPSHFYCYSFAPNPYWSRVYSPQAEIQAYIESTVDKFGVSPYLVNGAKILRLELDDAKGLWNAHFADGNIVQARHVINGSGGLHVPSIPNFPGRHSFQGKAMHTAQWDASVDLSGKKVAVIGSAASAIQAIPEIAKIAKKLSVFQRTPNYIAPRNDREYTEKEKQRFAKWPLLGRLHRWKIFTRMDLLLYPIVKKNSKRGIRGGKLVMKYMRSVVKDKSLHKKLEPDYVLGCKRILISDDFYQSLNRENVELVTEGLSAIEENGIRTSDDRLHEVDVIVYATGFDIDQHIRSISVTGMNQIKLDDIWSKYQQAYNGACVAGFPNYYMVTGPNTGVATTSVVYMVEQQVDYILKLMEKAGKDKLIAVSKKAEDAYNDKLHAALDQTVWASGCKSWYIDEFGKITTLYPGNARAFKKQSNKVRMQDFELHSIA